MNEENQTNTTVTNETPKPKKGGVAKKIIIAVVALIVIAAIVIGVLLATGVLDVNLSKKSKMVAGVEKIGERLSNTMDDLSGNAKDSSTSTIKIFNNLNKDSEVEFSGEVSAKVDSFDVDSSVASVDKSTVETILDIINSSKIGMNIKYDGREKAAASINGKIDNVELSGEVVYDGEQVAVRSEEISPKWIAISKEDIEEMIESEGVDFEQIEEMINKMTDQMVETAKSLEVDEKTQEEIAERYEKVLKDFIDKKSKDIKSEKDKVTVDGKSKNCEKLTLELDGDDVKDLLIEYVDTFKSDKKLQEIIRKALSAYSDAFSDVYYQTKKTVESNSTSLPGDDIDPQFDNILDELLDNIDEVKEEIKDLDLDVKIVLTVYATNTDVYRTDVSILVDKMEIRFETTFNKEDTIIDVAMKSSGIKVDVATITIKSEKNSASIKVETADGIEEYLGEKMSVEISCKNDDKKTELVISADLGKTGKASISLVSNINKNEDNEYAGETVLNFDIDIENAVTTKGNLNITSNMKLGNVSIQSIPASETVDAKDEAAVEAYMTEAQTNIVELMDKVSKIEGLSELLELPSSPVVETPEAPEEPELPDVDF